MPYSLSPGELVSYVQPFVTVFMLCTTCKNSPLRRTNVAVLTVLTIAHWRSLSGVPMTAPSESFLRIVPLSTLLHTAILFVCVDPADIRAQPDVRSAWDQVLVAIRLTADYRAIGTRWQVRNIPPFAPAVTSIGRISRVHFVTRQLAVALWQALVLDLLAYQLPRISSVQHHLDAVLRDPSQAGPWVVEAATAVITWFIICPLSIDAGDRTMSALLVTLGLTPPENWPPMFGSVSEAYTLRNFWGKYWHQGLRWPLTATSTSVLRRWATPSRAWRSAHLILCFVLSGLIHLPAQAKGLTLAVPGAVNFFGGFGIAIVVEDALRAGWHRVPGHRSALGVFLARGAGYAWVLGWLAWLGPYYSYDMAFIGLVSPLPVSPIPWLGVNGVLGLVLGGGLLGAWFLGVRI